MSNNARLAQPVFVTGALDDNLTVDGYGVKDTTTRNATLDVFNTFGADAASAIKANPGIIDQLKRTSDLVQSGRLKPADLLTRAGSLLGGIAGPVRNLAAGLQSQLVDGMVAAGMDRDGATTIFATIGAGLPIALKANPKDLRGMADLANAVSRSPDLVKVIDQVGEVTMLSTVSNYAVEAGMPDLLDEMVKASSSSTVARGVMSNVSGTAINSGDLRAVQKVTSVLGGSALKAQHPDVVKRVGSSYRLPAGSTKADHATQGTELVTTLSSIDPQWDTTLQGGTRVSNLGAFSSMSPDARTVLATVPTYQNELALAPSYPTMETGQYIKSAYPYALQ